MENKRKITQWITTVLYNLNIKGLLSGDIYRGKTKGICVPGLNCYSCPGALGSCPLGSLQSQFSSIKRSVNLYVMGTLALFGTIFGRFTCGWMCPFGLLQELLYRIPVKKSKLVLRKLRFLRYVFLAAFVVGIPLFLLMTKGIGAPTFCKYICPQGTIASMLMLPFSQELREIIGGNFAMKILVLILILAICLFIYRPFCTFICPLGAIYGMFNSIAIVRIHFDSSKCNGCNECNNVCPMKLDVKTECNKSDCIRCGLCTETCGSNALNLGIRKKSH